ncbi:TIGR04104 family putative zinc finger protein [Halalkalibacter okhensis]|uniref:Cxxc_20_cxxc protein n=1 Tax=Halalkalibacter okhensis TaxID=333138 RepID=A0A0B0IGP3_9BACI|nr:hypothetical protein LQ50_16120 [Halalkalibacter okhensis]
MVLHKCDVCFTSFRYGDVLKSILLGYKPLTCSKCSVELKVTIASRVLTSVLTILIPLIVAFNIASEPIYQVAIFLLFGFGVSFFLPFIIRYSSRSPLK